MHWIIKILVQIGGHHYLRTYNGQYRDPPSGGLYRLDSRLYEMKIEVLQNLCKFITSIIRLAPASPDEGIVRALGNK